MGIGSIFRHTPNHVKLVRDCYPHSKTAVEPDSNSLGKLTFYTKRRPIKLSKVGRALLSRSQKSSESIGHLCVTLTILKKLLAECRNDVNVFSKEAIAIINIAFNRAQTFSRAFQTNPHTLLELYEKTADAFYALATFSQALAVEEIAYLALLQQFCNLVHNDKTMQLRLIGIHALEGAVSSELFHQLELDQQARLVVPLLLFAILDSRADPRNLEEGGSHSTSGTPNVNMQSKDGGPLRPPLTDRRARSIRIAKGLQGTERPPDKDDAAKAAIGVLKIAFRLAQPRHLEVLLSQTTTYLDSRDDTWSHPKWCCWLAGRYMEWTQAQYRFAIVKFWLDEIDLVSEPELSETEDYKSSLKQETVLAVLVDQLSSPKTSVVNLAFGEVLSTLIEQIIKNPQNIRLKQGILALSSHIYYPEQINDLVGDLLSAVLDLSGSSRGEQSSSSQRNESAKLALLDCCKELVIGQKSAGFRLSGEQMHGGLSILNDPSVKIRLAYLGFLIATFQSQPSQRTTDRQETSMNSHAEVPAITVQSTNGGSNHASANDLSRFSRDLQMRLFYFQHVSTMTPAESDSMAKLLSAIYAKREGQVVLEGMPVLVSWQNGEHSDKVKMLVGGAFQTIANTWEVNVSENEHIIPAIASSTSLQEATALSETDLRERLSQPYSLSPLSARNSISHNHHNHAHNKKARSTHGSNENNHNLSLTSANRLSRPSSLFTTSLADLKQSLGRSSPNDNGNGHAHMNGNANANGSPDRSVTGASTASSFVERGSMTPPNGVNGHAHLSPPKSLPESTRAGGTRKPRLDRIIGSTDDGRSSPASSKSPVKIRSPPYQLS